MVARIFTRKYPYHSFLVAIASIALFNAHGFAQIGGPKSGAEFQRELSSPAGVSWEGEIELRAATQKLAKHHGVAIMLDRRIDPGRKVLASRNASLEIAIRTLAEQLKLGVCFFDGVAYIGPPDPTSKMTTVAAILNDKLSELPDSAKRRLVQKLAWQWNDLAVPKELLGQLAVNAGVTVSIGEKFPHDLWAANHLPPMNFVERATLLLAGFDRSISFEPDGKTVQLIPFPDRVALTRSYPVPPADIGRFVRILKDTYPDASIEPAAGKIVVVASLDLQNVIRDRLAGKAARPPKPMVGAEKVYTLNVENKEVGAVVMFLAKQLEFEARFDAAAQAKTKDLTTFNVKDATVRQLFKAVLDPVGLTFRIEGNKLTVLKP